MLFAFYITLEALQEMELLRLEAERQEAVTTASGRPGEVLAEGEDGVVGGAAKFQETLKDLMSGPKE